MHAHCAKVTATHAWSGLFPIASVQVWCASVSVLLACVIECHEPKAATTPMPDARDDVSKHSVARHPAREQAVGDWRVLSRSAVRQTKTVPSNDTERIE